MWGRHAHQSLFDIQHRRIRGIVDAVLDTFPREPTETARRAVRWILLGDVEDLEALRESPEHNVRLEEWLPENGLAEER